MLPSIALVMAQEFWWLFFVGDEETNAFWNDIQDRLILVQAEIEKLLL